MAVLHLREAKECKQKGNTVLGLMSCLPHMQADDKPIFGILKEGMFAEL